MMRARGGTTYHKLIRNYREKKHVNFIVSRIFSLCSLVNQDNPG